MKRTKQAAAWMLQEWKELAKNPKIMIALFGMLLVPVLYSATYLWAFWDPYGHLERLPVAVVNSDKSVVYDGKTYSIGKDLEDNLREDPGFDWHFTDLEDARKGLADNRYYILIEIPENFSSNATTLMENQPQPLTLYYTANTGYNYIASRIGESGVAKIKEELSKKLIENYSESIFSGITEVADGMKKASDGANDLKDGAAKLSDGTGDLLSTLQEKNPQIRELADGAAAIGTNAKKLADGAKQLDSGFKAIRDGVVAAEKGTKQLNDGTTQLAQGAGNLQQGIGQFGDGLAKAADGASKLAPGIGQLSDSANKLSTGAGQLEQLAAAIMQKHPDLADDSDLNALVQASKQLAGGTKQLADGAGQLKGASTQLSGGLDTLSDKQKLLQQGAADLKAGSSKLAAGASQANQGLGKLTQGTNTFNDKMGELSSGSGQLSAGAQKLSTGVASVATGWTDMIDGVKKLDDGQKTLFDGTKELSDKLAEGAAKTADIHASQQTYEMLSNPVHVDEKPFHPVPNYGTALAPYFLSLSLFVGALLLTTVFPITETKRLAVTPFSWFLNKFVVLCGVGVLQALIASFVLLYGLGVETQSNARFIWFAIFVSLTFMAMIQFLVSAFKDVGRFIGIILLVLQLTGSAGTYPLELVPQLLQNIHAYLPMTYAVNGFRAVISSGDFSALTTDVLALAIFAVVSIALSIITFTVKLRKSSKLAEAV